MPAKITPGHIILCGFMGAGKSSLGPRLARVLDLPFMDTDSELERAHALTVSDMFRLHGEQWFRDQECQLLARALPGGRRMVMALGGGALLTKQNRELARRHGILVWLHAPVSLLWQRSRGTRPLATEQNAFSQRYAERLPAYQSVCDLVVQTDSAPGPLLAGLRAALKQPVYGFYFNHGACGAQRFLLTSRFSPSLAAPQPARCLFVIDARVFALHKRTLLPCIQDRPVLQLHCREAGKGLTTVREIYAFLHKHRACRRTEGVAVGGGVLQDMALYAFATYNRGIPASLVPTTLIAQIDASIGGKCGVNAYNVKNLVGTFYLPRRVYAATDFLATLPDKEVRSGLAELLKYALLQGWDNFAALKPVVEDALAPGDRPFPTPGLRPFLLSAIHYKLSLTHQDFKEQNMRRLLNLGHTLAHALETLSEHRLNHGQAVALGLIYSAHIAHTQGHLSTRYLHALSSLCRLLLDRIPSLPSFKEVHQAMGYDKKRNLGRLPLVLPSDTLPRIQVVEEGLMRESYAHFLDLP